MSIFEAEAEEGCTIPEEADCLDRSTLRVGKNKFTFFLSRFGRSITGSGFNLEEAAKAFIEDYKRAQKAYEGEKKMAPTKGPLFGVL
ncbi:MAG: hypothetical protein KGL67_02185 [Patescibacteria group bacterium]|nr:hypothetical protein [Patescibacteria group bacterium]